MNTKSNTSAGRGGSGRALFVPLRGEYFITLTVEEIADLVKFCGLILKEEPNAEEKETEVTIQSWPEKGVRDDDGVTMLPPHKCIAYYEDYPEEGCVPLGSPNVSAVAPATLDDDCNNDVMAG